MKTPTKTLALSLLVMLQVNIASATCKVQLAGSNPSDSFLIEGCPAADTACCLPAMALVSDLAQSMGASVIDCIHSFDYEHLSSFILGIPHKTSPLTPDEQKLLAAFIVLHFNTSTSTLNQFIKEPYKKMVENRLMSAIPDWVNHLSKFTADAFIQESLDKYGDDEHALGAALADIFNRSVAVSNEVSKDSLLDYLSKNPNIKTVRGLIGKTHLPFLDSAEQVIRCIDTHRQIQVTLDSRKVDVFLYGGTHAKNGVAVKSNSETEQDKVIECIKPKDRPEGRIDELLSPEFLINLLQQWRNRHQDKL